MIENIEYDKKQIKKLNDFNQITKNYFQHYYTFNSGLIVCRDNEKFKKAQKGFHFCTTTIFPICEIEKLKTIGLTSDYVYKIIKDRKKEINGLIIENNEILFSMGENAACKIGNILELTNLPNDLKDNYNLAAKTLNQCLMGTKYTLSDDEVTTLMTNGIILYQQDGYKLRLTKELIPNLKKDSTVNIQFFDIEKEESLFHVVINVEWEDINSYHKYTCIRF